MKNLLMIALAVVTLQSCKQEKTAYVNNTKVVSDYKEMKDAETKWTKKNDELRSELQQKAMAFQKEVQDFEAKRTSLSKKKLEELATELQGKQQKLQREQQMRVQEIQQQSGAEIDTIVEKVKKYIRKYGEDHGYTYIYGDTETSNILYGKKELDITEEILSAMNKEIASTNTTEEPAKEHKEDAAKETTEAK